MMDLSTYSIPILPELDSVQSMFRPSLISKSLTLRKRNELCIQSVHNTLLAADDGPTVEGFDLHPNLSMLSLGIFLLELELSCAIKSQKSSKQVCEDEALKSDYNRALCLFDENRFNMFYQSSEAIETCLRPTALRHTFSFKDSDFYRAFYHDVVSPLEQQFLIGFGIHPRDVGKSLEKLGFHSTCKSARYKQRGDYLVRDGRTTNL
jgi:hypothetical protein